MRLNALMPALVAGLLFCGPALAADPAPARLDRLEYDFGQLSSRVEALEERLAALEASGATLSVGEVAETYDPETKVAIPSGGTPWTYSGDDGSRASMIEHLQSGNHRSTVMAWMGISDPSEYDEELGKLTYSELKRLHSLDHNKATLTSTARHVKATPAASRSTVTVSATSGHYENRRAGLFGRRTVRVWVPDNGPTATTSSTRRAPRLQIFSGGCPGGVCPL